MEKIQETGAQRLYPRLSNPNWLVLRGRREIFRQWLRDLPVRNPSVLDIGGRIQPYRPLLVSEPKRYVSADLRITTHVNVVADAALLPFAEGEFDLIVCTQMLEYAPDPRAVMLEAHRILRTGGVLLLSVPSLALRDADEDLWRFWPGAIRQLLSSFSEVEIVPEVRSVSGLFRTVNAGLNGLAKFQFLRSIFKYSVIPALNLVGLGLENLLQSQNDAFAVNYSARARK